MSHTCTPECRDYEGGHLHVVAKHEQLRRPGWAIFADPDGPEARLGISFAKPGRAPARFAKLRKRIRVEGRWDTSHGALAVGICTATLYKLNDAGEPERIGRWQGGVPVDYDRLAIA